MIKIYFLLILSSISLSIFAKSSALGGSILYIKGSASSGPINGQFTPIVKGKIIPYGEVIKTEMQSFVLLQLGEAIKVKINADSELKIKKPEVNDQGGKKRNIFLRLGSAFVNVEPSKMKNNGDSFKLRTKTVSMGVRGTKFFAAISKKRKKSSKDDVWMCVSEGKVVVNKLGDSKEVLVKKGEGIVVKEGKAISKPMPLPWTSNLNWSMNLTENMENKLSIEQAYYDLLDIDYD